MDDFKKIFLQAVGARIHSDIKTDIKIMKGQTENTQEKNEISQEQSEIIREQSEIMREQTEFAHEHSDNNREQADNDGMQTDILLGKVMLLKKRKLSLKNKTKFEIRRMKKTGSTISLLHPSSHAHSLPPYLPPPSHSLTQTDREYYNIIRTEDGQSGFLRGHYLGQMAEQDQQDRRVVDKYLGVIVIS